MPKERSENPVSGFVVLKGKCRVN